jgi:hypothetical protein
VRQVLERFGRVVDAHGVSVPGAIVVIAASSVPMPEIALVTDGTGRFSMRLPPGVFTIRAHGAGGTGAVDLEDGRTDEEIVIPLARETRK